MAGPRGRRRIPPGTPVPEHGQAERMIADF